MTSILALYWSLARMRLTDSSARSTFGTPMMPFSSAKGESGSKSGVKGCWRATISLFTPPLSDVVCCVVMGVKGRGPSPSKAPAVCRFAMLEALAFNLLLAAFNPDSAMLIDFIMVLLYHGKC